MHILLISACEKRAIKKTRALLDSYALRVGEKTWSTPITQEALIELRTALKRNATRQTAVACYRNDGRKRMKLLWIVGSRATFGPNGHFPAGTQKKKSSGSFFLPFWARIGSMLSQNSGQAHDFGKATVRFDEKLRNGSTGRDAVRHEWISVKLMQSLRRHEYDWEKAWKALDNQMHELVLGNRTFDPDNVSSISNALEATDYLVATHHGLFSGDGNSELAMPTTRGHLVRDNPSKDLLAPAGSVSPSLLKRWATLEQRLCKKTEHLTGNTLFWRALLVYARAALIFADHSISSLKEKEPGMDDILYANTKKFDGVTHRNQPLEKHLTLVCDNAGETFRHMAQLTALAQSRNASYEPLSGLSEETVERITAPSDASSRFNWHNRCAQALAEIHERHPDASALILNTASTGSGKTVMNARTACIMSREANLRFSIALNLRSLTLQTGDALADRLHIGKDELSTVIGDRTAQQLHDHTKTVMTDNVDPSEGNEDENRTEAEIDCVGSDHPLPEWLSPFFNKERERLVLSTPLLVSTIDFLIAAGNPQSQGHHVKALLRLMSADLVLDEIDSYEPDALVSILRLVQLSALFRRNVICSSATLSLPVAKAIESAYRSGVTLRRTLEQSDPENQADNPDDSEQFSFVCALIDDQLPPYTALAHPGSRDFEDIYSSRLKALSRILEEKPVYRLAALQPVRQIDTKGWMSACCEGVLKLHRQHAYPCSKSGKRISFGLVRVANIRTAVLTARYLAKAIPCARVACYHANELMIARFYKERRLDKLLSRHQGNTAIENDAEIAALLADSPSDTIPFIVVATPVEEVGRDHDFDWAVLDPSSAHSLIQTGGRVNRHRMLPCNGIPNILIMQYNYRHCKNAERNGQNRPAFIYPGYESSDQTYQTHDMAELFPWETGDEQYKTCLDARLRFQTESCQLARLDDKSIRERLDTFFGESGQTGLFISNPVDYALLSEQPYLKTPLRSFTKKEQWRMIVEDGKPRFERKDFVPVPNTAFCRELWAKQDMKETNFPSPNAWLFLSAEDMLALCEETGIEPEQGMQVDLAVYRRTGTSGTFEYDPGFGIYRTEK